MNFGSITKSRFKSSPYCMKGRDHELQPWLPWLERKEGV